MKAVYKFNCVEFFSDKTNYKKYNEFYNLEIFLLKLILSINSAKKFFGQVELNTDVYGALLLEQLELPFDSIHINFIPSNLSTYIDCTRIVAACEKNKSYYKSVLANVKEKYPEFLSRIKLVIRRHEKRGLGSEFLYENNL